MAIATIETTRPYSLHPALARVKAIDLLEDLRKSYPDSLIEAGLPNFLPPTGIEMRLASLAKAVLRGRVGSLSSRVNRYIEDHSQARVLVLAKTMQNPDFYPVSYGVALVARRMDEVELFHTSQKEGTWVRYENLHSPPYSPLLQAAAKDATLIPTPSPYSDLLAIVGFAGAQMVSLEEVNSQARKQS